MPNVPLTEGASGDAVRELHAQLVGQGYNIPSAELTANSFGPGTKQAVQQFQQKAGLGLSGAVDAPTLAALAALPPAGQTPPRLPSSPAAPPPAADFVVSGTVFSNSYIAPTGLRVDIVDKNVGPDVTLATSHTTSGGGYNVSFSTELLRRTGKSMPDIQAIVYSGDTLWARSDVRYNAVSPLSLNVLLPDNLQKPPSEHESLVASLAQNYKGSLADLRESADRQDITYLANKTGWDARAVAMAAMATQLSNASTTAGTDKAAPASIAPEFYYALFRAGLPADPDTLYQTSLSTVKNIWQQAISQGVIPVSLGNSIEPAARAFQNLAAKTALTAAPLVGLSTLKDFLDLRLPNNAASQQQFATLYTQHRDDLPGFWKAIGDVFGSTTAQQLHLDGRLAYLTLNNAPLVSQLHQAQGQQPLTTPVDLVTRGYFQPDRWLPLLSGAIPAEIPGATPAEQRTNYANLLATHIRLAFPTAVLAQMVSSGAIAVKAAANAAPVAAFLMAQQGKFEIGNEPVEAFLARNQLTGTVSQPVVNEVKRIQRVYQITPTDQALAVLFKNNIDSAYAVTRYSSDGFVQAFGQLMGGDTIAAQTYAKAMQVHGAVLNIATGFLNANSAPPLGNTVQGYVLDAKVTSSPPSSYPIIAYPTLEGLLGSMDFCGCTECRSITGPAAYMVNLLEYLDSKTPVLQNPQAVLFARRPDLKYLPLTCENTNVALPYIDLVNETMEYFVANGLSIANYQGHDTGSSISSDELMANPQYVNEAAYSALQTAWFPPPLPFDRPLELLRLHFQKLGVPLQDAMAALRPSDAIERGGAVYGWRDILMEQIGISRPEHRILTDSTLTLEDLYGYPGLTDAAALANLSVFQDFSRRTGVSYQDIFTILSARFINPGAALIPRLQQLNVPFTTLRKLKDGSITPTNFKSLLPGGLDATQYGGANVSDLDAVVNWVIAPANYANIMRLITVSNPVVGKITVNGSYSTPQALSGTVGGVAWSFTTDGSGDLAAAASGIANAINAVAGIHSGYTAFSAGVVVRITPNDQGTVQSSFSIAATGTPSLTLTAAVTIGQDPCSAVDLLFRYANPDNTANMLGAVDFVRLMRFIRLWRKLGLTIEQTDDVISALYPGADLPTGASEASDLKLLDSGFLVLLQRIGFLYQVLNQLGESTGDALASLLACWAPIGITGTSSLYSAMFLTPTLLEADPAFAIDPYGNVLTDKTQLLLAPTHAATLRAAFNLTGNEFAAITSELGFNSTTVLTLENISAIYRIGWLAREIQISVVEFVLLTHFTDLDPFAPPDPSATSPAEPPVIRFIRLVQAANAAGLQPVQLLYLLWNQDISGLSVPPDSTIAGLALTLRQDFAAVESQFSLVDDPNGTIAKALMALVYGGATTDFFLGLLNNTVTTSVAYGNPQPTLAQPILDAAKGRLSYDDLRKQLIFGGVLDTATLGALQAAVTANGNYAPLQTALVALFTANHQMVDPFFTAYPELGPGPTTPYGIYVASSDSPSVKRTALLKNLLADLKSKRKQEQALASVAAAAGIDASFAHALLTDAQVMTAAGGTGAAAADLTAIENAGLSVQFFLTNNTALPPDQSADSAPALDYQNGGSNPLPPGSGGSPISASWSGFLAAPQDGDYNFQVTTDSGATVQLAIDGTVVTLTQASGVWTNTSQVTLVAGSLVPIQLTVTTVKNRVTVNWESKGLGWQVLPQDSLYSATDIGRLKASYIRFLKATSLADALALTANEMVWLATNSDLAISGHGWLNALVTSGTPDSSTFAGLRTVAQSLFNYARIKKALSPKDERFLQALQNPSATGQNGINSLLTLTGWSAESRDALLQQFFGSTALANLAHLANFQRVYDAAAKVATCGIAAAALINATTNDPTPAIVTALQSALRALYAKSDWLAVIKPINDKMRDQQRDALVAYILQRLGDDPATADVNTPDKLFQFFLMDVEMEPCMQTSRIRHALSSIQLFAERCVRNLEPLVSPKDIAADRWDVMKRYRLWQANIEVFLWPERWLYPELRDDQSPFFQRATKQLLQSDVTDDSAASAYLDYLTQLESVAKLQPCAIYYSPADSSKPPGEGDEFAHVISRTCGASAKYYYRQLVGGSWTPWQDTQLPVDDVPMAIHVWNGRLLVFWLRIVKHTVTAATASQYSQALVTKKVTTPPPNFASMNVDDARSQTTQGAPSQVAVQAILCWSEYYNGKWQPVKTSDVNNPTTIGDFDAVGPGQFDRTKYQLKVASYSGYQLVVSIKLSGQKFDSEPPGFLLYNTHSVPPALEDASEDLNWGSMNWRVFGTSYSGSGGTVDPNVAYPPSASPNQFIISYNKMVAIPTPHIVNDSVNQVLQSPMGERVLAPQVVTSAASAWNLPFFFEDSRNVFYVTTSQATIHFGKYLGYAGVLGLTAAASRSIANLVVPEVPDPIPFFAPVISGANADSASPDQMRRFVSEDAYIRTGIATTNTVSYQGTQIGPRGGLPVTKS